MTEVQKPAAPVFEDEDVFEEFGSHEIAEQAATDNLPLWEPGWDDEDTKLDFATKLREELDRDMKS